MKFYMGTLCPEAQTDIKIYLFLPEWHPFYIPKVKIASPSFTSKTSQNGGISYDSVDAVTVGAPDKKQASPSPPRGS